MQGSETTKVDGKNSSTTSKQATVTNKGAYGSLGKGKEHKGEKLTLGAKASADGSVVLDVKATKDNPPEYVMTLSVKVGGSISGSAGNTQKPDSKGSVSGNASVGASAEMVYSHKMNKKEAQNYVDKLAKYDKGSKTNGKMPEFSMLDRMSVFKDQVAKGQMVDAGALFSSKSGAAMDAGDSVELTLTGNASVGGKASGKGGMVSGGIEAGASMEKTRKLKISNSTVKGKKMVDLTLAFAGKEGWNAGGNLAVYHIGMKGGYKEEKSGGLSATFRLDPKAADFSDLYDGVLGVYTKDGLKALSTSKQYKKHLQTQVTEEGESNESNAAVTVPGVEVGRNHGSAYEGKVTTGKDGMTGEFTGSSHQGTSVKAAGVSLHDDKTTDSGTAKVDKKGNVDVDLRQTNVNSSVTNSGGEKKESNWLDVLKKTPKQQVESKINTTLTSMWGITLDNNGFETLIKRSRNYYRWNDCAAGSLDTMQAWWKLDDKLNNPKPSKEWSDKDPKLAKKLYQAQTLAKFMKNDGAILCLKKCLYEWGEHGAIKLNQEAPKYGHYGVGEKDVGTLYEWPSSIMKHKKKFDAATTFLSDSESKISTYKNGDSVVLDFFAKTLTKHENFLIHLPRYIEECKEFTMPRAKMEMINSVRSLRRKLIMLDIKVRDKEGKISSDRMKEIDHGIELRQNIRLFGSMKKLENQLYKKMKDEDDDYFVDDRGITKWCSQLDNVHEFWITKIQQTRALYNAQEKTAIRMENKYWTR